MNIKCRNRKHYIQEYSNRARTSKNGLQAKYTVELLYQPNDFYFVQSFLGSSSLSDSIVRFLLSITEEAVLGKEYTNSLKTLQHADKVITLLCPPVRMFIVVTDPRLVTFAGIPWAV